MPSLSEQVLRLLTRDNSWSGVDTYERTVGLKLERATLPLADPTDRLENRGGNLYFNNVLVAASAGAGTVTSVALTLPAIFSLTGSPIVSSGTFAVTLATQLANRVWAGPGSGSAATPTFRALVDADIPADITINGTGNVTWASVSKSGSSLADLATRSAADLSSGTLPDARFPATLPAASGVNLTALNATQLTSGTLPAGRFPALTGDLTTTAGSLATTLANSGVSAGSYGSASLVPVITVDAKGRITAITTASATPGGVTGAANGGTGQSSYTVGDLIQATATTTLSKLAAVATGNVLLSGGVATASAWGKVALTTHVSGILPVANGGTGVLTVPSNGFIPIGNGTNYVAAAITGTANQVVVTNGAGTITLSTPQSINTSSTPQFARLGLGTGAGASAVLTTAGQFNVGIFDDGSGGASKTIDWSAGMVHKILLTQASCTLTLTNPIAGAPTYELQVTQDGSGNRTIVWPGTVIWEGGVAPTLTTTAAAIDYVWLRWNGTNYLGYALLDFS